MKTFNIEIPDCKRFGEKVYPRARKLASDIRQNGCGKEGIPDSAWFYDEYPLYSGFIDRDGFHKLVREYNIYRWS